MDLMERFSHLLSTNNTPKPAELASIVEEVALMKDAISNRQLELEKLESDCRALESLLAPLRRVSLPPETLGEIFGHALEACASEFIPSQLQTICLVCKIWRDAALATPRLWDNLAITLRKGCRLDLAEKWLARAGSLPRRVGLCGVSGSPGRCPGECLFRNLDFTGLLAQDSIEHLSLECYCMECFENFPQDAKSLETSHPRPWNSLKSLRLYTWCWTSPVVSQPTITFFQHLPRSLTSLWLNIPSFDCLDSSENISTLDLPNLKFLDLTCESVSWILKSLNGSPNLERLGLNLASREINYDEFEDGTECTLSKLRSLCLRGLKSEDTGMLDEMTCPILAELDIGLWVDMEVGDYTLEDTEEWFATHILDFIERSNCVGTLGRVRLHSFTISNSFLVTVLRGLQSVKHLVLDNLDIKGYPFQQIAGEGLLPRLEILEFRNIYHTRFDYNSVYEFIKSRHPGDRTLTQADDVSSPSLLKEAIITINPEENERPKRLADMRLTKVMKDLGVDIVKAQRPVGEDPPWRW